MSRPRVKICGHTDAGDVRATVRAGADAAGVICDVPVDTPREVGAERATTLLDAVPPLVTGVLVTMPDGPEEAIALVERTDPDALQIHGPFDPDDLAAVREAIDRPVFKAVEPDDADAFAGIADALLVDSADETGAGGTGRTHDWERTRALVERLDVPILLAGGLTPENVAEAVETVGPFGVDVASGVEREARPEGSARTDERRRESSAPEAGRASKDHDAVERFVENATRPRRVIEG